MKLDNDATLNLMRKIAAVDMSNPAYEDVGRANDAIRIAIDNVPLRDLKNAMAALPGMAWEESLKKGRDFHESVVKYLTDNNHLSTTPPTPEVQPEEPAAHEGSSEIVLKSPKKKAEPKKKADVKKIDPPTEEVVDSTTSEEPPRPADNGPVVDSAFSAFRDSVFTRLDDMTDHVQVLSASVLENTTAVGDVHKNLASLEQKLSETNQTLKAGLRDMEKNIVGIMRKMYTEFRECIADPDRPYAPPDKLFGSK